MLKIDKPKRDIELEIAEAKIELAVLKYENYRWLHPKPNIKRKVQAGL